MSSDANPPRSKPTLPERLHRLRARTDWMMLFPVAAALSWALGGTGMTMVLVVILPICVALQGHGRGSVSQRVLEIDTATGRPMHRIALASFIDDVLEDCARRNRTTAILQVQIADLQIADSEWGSELGEKVMDRISQRIATVMRGQDAIIRSGDTCLTLILHPTKQANLDVVMTIVDRIQAAVGEPISIDGRSVRVRSCIGICSEAMAPIRAGAAFLAAADCALHSALMQGENSVRAFNPDLQSHVETEHKLSLQINDALDAEQICAWFQPQIDAATGQIVGFEALARWEHPELGLLLPARFLPSIHSAGRIGDLGEVMLRSSLQALVAWDGAGLHVPQVGVNISLEELCDPRLAARLIWLVDRYNLTPDRIAIEILETVTLRKNDETIVRNIRLLREAGFRLDLDDFGTGAASIAHIARFGVHRIKLDRSFVQNINLDPGRQRLVNAILRLTESLGIEMLAEGVETPAERAVLTDMGCPQLQGFGIARPMPFKDTLSWASSQRRTGPAALHAMQPKGRA